MVEISQRQQKRREFGIFGLGVGLVFGLLVFVPTLPQWRKKVYEIEKSSLI